MKKARLEILYLDEDGEKSAHVMPEEYIAQITSFLEKGFWFEQDNGKWIGIPAYRILKITYWPIGQKTD